MFFPCNRCLSYNYEKITENGGIFVVSVFTRFNFVAQITLNYVYTAESLPLGYELQRPL